MNYQTINIQMSINFNKFLSQSIQLFLMLWSKNSIIKGIFQCNSYNIIMHFFRLETSEEIYGISKELLNLMESIKEFNTNKK